MINGIELPTGVEREEGPICPFTTTLIVVVGGGGVQAVRKGAPCAKERCALWDADDSACRHVSVLGVLSAGLFSVQTAIDHLRYSMKEKKNGRDADS